MVGKCLGMGESIMRLHIGSAVPCREAGEKARACFLQLGQLQQCSLVVKQPCAGRLSDGAATAGAHGAWR